MHFVIKNFRQVSLSKYHFVWLKSPFLKGVPVIKRIINLDYTHSGEIFTYGVICQTHKADIVEGNVEEVLREDHRQRDRKVSFTASAHICVESERDDSVYASCRRE